MKHKNISFKENDKYIILRIVYKKKPYNKCYIVKQWRSFKAALASAINHRDNMKTVFRQAKKHNLILKDW